MDLRECIPATNYATRNIDAILPKIQNIEDSLALLQEKARRTERSLEYALENVAAFEVLDDTKPPQAPTPPPSAMLESSLPQQILPDETSALSSPERRVGEHLMTPAAPVEMINADNAINEIQATLAEHITNYHSKYELVHNTMTATMQQIRALERPGGPDGSGASVEGGDLDATASAGPFAIKNVPPSTTLLTTTWETRIRQAEEMCQKMQDGNNKFYRNLQKTRSLSVSTPQNLMNGQHPLPKHCLGTAANSVAPDHGEETEDDMIVGKDVGRKLNDAFARLGNCDHEINSLQLTVDDRSSSIQAVCSSIEPLPALADMVKQLREHQTSTAESIGLMSLQLAPLIPNSQPVQKHGQGLRAAEAKDGGDHNSTPKQLADTHSTKAMQESSSSFHNGKCAREIAGA